MSILSFKIIAIFFIVFVALLGGRGAFRIKSSKKSSLYFSIGNTFAAGIFLGAGLIHMLPDATQGFSEVIDSDFPFAPFIASLGFLLILFIEKIMIREEDIGSYPYILIAILSIHSVIAGIALGTENQIGQSIVIAIVVLAHKGSAAFALTISMIKAQIQKIKTIKMIILFSFMTPLGIAIGTIMTNLLDSTASEFSIAMFDALAAGTFIYIAIMEIFHEEFKDRKYLYLKFFMSISGVLFMALLALWL